MLKGKTYQGNNFLPNVHNAIFVPNEACLVFTNNSVILLLFQESCNQAVLVRDVIFIEYVKVYLY